MLSLLASFEPVHDLQLDLVIDTHQARNGRLDQTERAKVEGRLCSARHD